MVRAMTRILLALPTLAAFAAPASAIDRNYPISDFDRVIVEGPYRVHLVIGRSTTAAASGTRDGLDRVSVDVQGQTLRIRRARYAWAGTAGADTGPVTIALTTRALRSARLIGPATLDVDGAQGLNVTFVVEGSGRIRATRVAAETLSLGLLGSGTLDIAGTADTLRGEFQGSGNVEAPRLVAKAAVIATNTGGTVAVTVNGPATVTANGLGDVFMFGTPNCVLNGPGMAQVRCGGSDQRQNR